MLTIGDDRTANVRAIAARIASQAEGLSVREFLDACALSSGTMIRELYRGRGVAVAVERYNDAFQRALRKEKA